MTGIVGASIIILGLTLALCICCCLRYRKKDQGSYALDAALNTKDVVYTKVQGEYYA